MLLHGKKMAKGDIGDMEFFLRRITTLSLYMFGILAFLARMAHREKAGLTGEGLLHVLDYFVAEAIAVRRQNRRVFNSKEERLNSVVFRDLETEV